MNETALQSAAGTNDSDWQATRLAELVLHLTGCSADEALSAVADPDVATPVDSDQALELVARAIVRVRR